jgi:hypothetical protein
MQTFAVLWLGSAVWLNCTGWVLAALHQLNPAGYAVALLPGILLALVWLKKNPPAFHPPKLSRRFRRPLPAIFLFLTALIFLGGILHAPSNYDALTYRLPRMMNWLLAGKWFWIPTLNDRMNFSGVAWEWLALPFLALTRSDRGLFLINALGFLLLPGLLFSVFRQLGVARRVAWTWMWFLPLAAYGYATQAGSIGNDLTGTVFGLLSVHFGLRARRSGRVTDVWLAGLAAALMTGVKLSNLPLALPCLVAVWPALKQLPKKFTGSLAVAGLAVLISAVPIMALNQIYAGGWNGDPQNIHQVQIKNPAAALLGNSILLAEASLMPPVLPGSGQISSWLVHGFPEFLKKDFPRLFNNKLNELPGEEGAGLGLGISLSLLIVSGVAVWGFRRGGFLKGVFLLLPPVVLASWISALVYMAKMGSESGPRLLLPYYPLVLIPWLLLPAQSQLLRRQAWRVFLAVMALSALPVIILSVTRPLWPAQSVSAWLTHAQPENKFRQRLATTYAAYARRNDVLAPLRSALPEDAREIGFIASGNDTDYSLWRPFGQRKVKYVRHDIRHFLETPDVEWLVVKQNIWPQVSAIPLETWAREHHAQIVLTTPIVELVSWGPENWCVLRLEKPAHPENAAAP